MKAIRLTTGLLAAILFFGFSGGVMGQVRINEIRADDASTDESEFIELIGVAGTDITGYQIKHVNGAGGGNLFTHTIGTFTIPDDGDTDSESNAIGYYVLGVGGFSTGTDESRGNSLQNGPEGIILYDSEGNVVDAVAYGSAGDVNGDVTTSGSTSADNYLHVTQSDANDDNSLQAPNDVVGDNGGGWTYAAATIGALNDGQTSGSIVLASSVKAEPANHVTSFTADGSSAVNTISLSWTDATGSPAPDAYLIKIHETDYASISTPVDGTAESDDTDISDGSGVLNISQGTESASFSGLDETTTYYFKIYPYTNSGSDINYKTDGTVEQDDATTLETPDIVLNEFLADPPADTDVNGDGTNSTSQDEFIEFVNTGSSDLDISSWTIEEGAGLAHTFPASTVLKPYQAIVVFSGGSVSGDFGGAITQISTEGYALNNTGDDIILKNTSGVEIINYSYGSEGGNDESITRSVDLTGGFTGHKSADSEDGSAFSPGTRLDGSTFQPSVSITGSEGWRILSTPTSNNTYDDLLGDLWTQGIATGADVTNGTANVQTYDGSSFSAISDMGATMTSGVGFITYVYSDDDFDGSAEGFPKTLELFAVPKSGSVSPTLTSGANEWTLVGNPYYAGISWDNLTKTDLTGTVYVYDHSYGSVTSPDVADTGSAGGAYRTWNGNEGSLDNGRISSFQGFWVQNSGSGSPELTFEEADQISTDTTFFKQAQNESITIKLHGEMDNMFSESFLSFTEHGEVEKDNFDGLKLSPLDFRDYLSVATITGDTKLDINNLPADFEGELEIPLSVNAFTADAESKTWIAKGGDITLSWPVFKNISEDWSLVLSDYETGESINMKDMDSYEFSIDGSQQKKKAPVASILTPQAPQVEKLLKGTDSPRFTITVSKGEATGNETANKPERFKLEQNYPNPFNPSTMISYQVPEHSKVRLTVFNVMGQQVATLVDEAKSAGRYRVSWKAANMASGIYYYRLQAGSEVQTRQMTLIK